MWHFYPIRNRLYQWRIFSRSIVDNYLIKGLRDSRIRRNKKKYVRVSHCFWRRVTNTYQYCIFCLHNDNLGRCDIFIQSAVFIDDEYSNAFCDWSIFADYFYIADDMERISLRTIRVFVCMKLSRIGRTIVLLQLENVHNTSCFCIFIAEYGRVHYGLTENLFQWFKKKQWKIYTLFVLVFYELDS